MHVSSVDSLLNSKDPSTYDIVCLIALSHQAGKEGPRGRDFNMRWVASMVAEVHRILMRGMLPFFLGIHTYQSFA